MSTSRDQILDAVRRAAAGRLADAPAGRVLPGRAAGDADALRRRFVEMAGFAGATVAEIPDRAAVPVAIAAYLDLESLGPALVHAPDPTLAALPWDGAPRLGVRAGMPGAQDTVALTGAVAGVAETGSLLVASGLRAPNALHVLCPVHIALLFARDIVGGYEAALEKLRGENDTMPRAATFVTGPSRTADIEKTPQIGVHGPGRLHILLIDEQEVPDPAPA